MVDEKFKEKLEKHRIRIGVCYTDPKNTKVEYCTYKEIVIEKIGTENAEKVMKIANKTPETVAKQFEYILKKKYNVPFKIETTKEVVDWEKIIEEAERALEEAKEEVKELTQ